MTMRAGLVKLGLAAVLLLSGACGEERPAEPLAFEPGFVRQPAPGAISTAGYFAVTRSEDDALVGASTPQAAAVELHTVLEEGGVTRMRQLTRIPLPAGETVRLAPGGYHLMIIEPSDAFGAGGEVEIELAFESGLTGAITLPVERR